MIPKFFPKALTSRYYKLPLQIQPVKAMENITCLSLCLLCFSSTIALYKMIKKKTQANEVNNTREC